MHHAYVLLDTKLWMATANPAMMKEALADTTAQSGTLSFSGLAIINADTIKPTSAIADPAKILRRVLNISRER